MNTIAEELGETNFSEFWFRVKLGTIVTPPQFDEAKFDEKFGEGMASTFGEWMNFTISTPSDPGAPVEAQKRLVILQEKKLDPVVIRAASLHAKTIDQAEYKGTVLNFPTE